MSTLSFTGAWEALLDAIFPRSRAERFVLSLPASSIIRQAPLKERLPSWQHAALSYRTPLAHTLINLLKYKNSSRAAEKCAEILFHELPSLLSESLPGERFVLVPIPTSRTRLRERGYSQTERIAERLIALQGEAGPLALSPLLVKSRETPHQTGTRSRRERLANLKDSFAVRQGIDPQGLRVILIDDVITTGATLTEARKTLKRVGAKEILALAVAH